MKTLESLEERDGSDLISTLTDLLHSSCSSNKSTKEIYQLILKEHLKVHSNDDTSDLMEYFIRLLEDQVNVLVEWHDDAKDLQNGATSTSLEDTCIRLNRLYDFIIARIDCSKRDENDDDYTSTFDVSHSAINRARKKTKEVEHHVQYLHEEMETRLFQILSSILLLVHLGTMKNENEWFHALQSIQIKTLYFLRSIQRHITSPLNVIAILQRYIHQHLESDESTTSIIYHHHMDALYLSTDVMFEFCNYALQSIQEHENDTQVTKSIIELLRSILPVNQDVHEHRPFHSQCSVYCILLVQQILTMVQSQPLFRHVYLDEIQKNLTKNDDSLCLLDTIVYLMLFHCEFQRDVATKVEDEQNHFEKKKYDTRRLLKHEIWSIRIFPSASMIQLLRLMLTVPHQWTEVEEVLWKPTVQMVIDTCLDILSFFFLVPFPQDDEHAEEYSYPIQSIKEYILEIYSFLSLVEKEKLVHVLFDAMDTGVHAINTYEFNLNYTDENSHGNTKIYRWVDTILSYQDILIDLIKNRNCQCRLHILHRIDQLANTTWNSRKRRVVIGIIKANEYLMEMFCIALVVQYETQSDTLDITDLYNIVQDSIFSFLENETKANGCGSIELGLILARCLIQSRILSQELSERIVETVISFVSHQDCHSCDPVTCHHALSFLTSLCTETASMTDHLCDHIVFLRHRIVGKFVYPLDEVFGHIKDLVMQLRLIRKIDEEPQTMPLSSGFSVLAFRDLPPYLRDTVKFKKNHGIVISPVSIAQGVSLDCLTEEDLTNNIILWMRFVHMLFDSYLLMGRVLSRNRKWSRDPWIMASIELIARDQNSFELTSTCQFSVHDDSKVNESLYVNSSSSVLRKKFDEVRLWHTLFIAVGMLGAILKNSYTDVELDLAKSDDIYRMMFILEKIYFLRSVNETEGSHLISLINSSIFSTVGIVPFSHLLACIRSSTMITKDNSALFRAFMIGAFEQSHHEPTLINVIRVLSINTSIITHALSILKQHSADNTSLRINICDIKPLVDRISSVLLWMNSLQAFFQCESYLSGRVEVAKPKLLFEVRGQIQLYMKRALMLVQFCADHRDLKFLDFAQGQDLMAMASLCDDSTIRLQLFDTITVILSDQNDHATLLLEASWQLFVSTMNLKDSLSDILLPPPLFQRFCHQLLKYNHKNSLSSDVIASLITLDKKKMGEFQKCGALVHSFLAYWGCLMSAPLINIDSFIGVIFDLNEAITASQTSSSERRKNKNISDRGLHIQGLNQEALFILYEVTFGLVVASTYHLPTLDYRDDERKNEILFSLLDCFGSMIKTLALFRDAFPKSIIYSCIRSSHLMIDICNDLIGNFAFADSSPSKNRTSNSLMNWVSKMKIECCDRIIELSNKLSNIVSTTEKVTINALRKKAQALSVCIYKKGSPFHMVPSSLEMFGTVEPTSNSKPNVRRITKNENHFKSPQKSKYYPLEPNERDEDMNDDDESFGATGDWGEVESVSDGESPQINLDFAL